jgi:hypothetical protein
MLCNRKGFVKVAVEMGVDGGIIPVYHFGNTQVRAAGVGVGVGVGVGAVIMRCVQRVSACA